MAGAPGRLASLSCCCRGTASLRLMPLPRPCVPQGMLRESQQASERLQKEYNALSEKVGRGGCTA